MTSIHPSNTCVSSAGGRGPWAFRSSQHDKPSSPTFDRGNHRRAAASVSAKTAFDGHGALARNQDHVVSDRMYCLLMSAINIAVIAAFMVATLAAIYLSAGK